MLPSACFPKQALRRVDWLPKSVCGCHALAGTTHALSQQPHLSLDSDTACLPTRPAKLCWIPARRSSCCSTCRHQWGGVEPARRERRHYQHISSQDTQMHDTSLRHPVHMQRAVMFSERCAGTVGALPARKHTQPTPFYGPTDPVHTRPTGLPAHPSAVKNSATSRHPTSHPPPPSPRRFRHTHASTCMATPKTRRA
jgi:hypothetical protein